MRFCVLRSGSSGNCTLVEHENCRILIDAGMSQKRIREVLEEAGTSPDKLNGIIITHFHSDHCNHSTLQVCLKYQIPLWIHSQNQTRLGTASKKVSVGNLRLNIFTTEAFKVGPLIFKPFEVSHDAEAVTSGFGIRLESHDTNNHFVYASDLGHFPDTLIPHFRDCKAIVLEANHDPELLWNNPHRPYIHKKRVAGECGHLSNAQTADALLRIFRSSSRLPQQVVLCHLSNDHNSPDLANETVGTILNEAGVSISIDVARRRERTSFFEIC